MNPGCPVYASLRSIDFRITEADGDVALQTDHRDTASIDAEWEISAIFAAARARSVLLSNRVPAVRFVLPGPVPARYEALVRQLGAAIQTGASGPAVPAAPDLEAEGGVVTGPFTPPPPPPRSLWARLFGA